MQNGTKTAYLHISASAWHGGPLRIVSLNMSHDLGRSLADMLVYLYLCSVYYASIIPAPTLTKSHRTVRQDEVFHTPELEPGRGTPHLALSPREISSKTHGLLDYLNIVQANWGAFFSEGMELCKNTPQSLRHPCKSGENWGGGGGKKKEAPYGGLLWAECVCFESSQDITLLQGTFWRGLYSLREALMWSGWGLCKSNP